MAVFRSDTSVAGLMPGRQEIVIARNENDFSFTIPKTWIVVFTPMDADDLNASAVSQTDDTAAWGSPFHPTVSVKWATVGDGQTGASSTGWDYGIALDDIPTSGYGRVLIRGPADVLSDGSVANGGYFNVTGNTGKATTATLESGARRLGIYYGPAHSDDDSISVVFSGIRDGFGVEP